MSYTRGVSVSDDKALKIIGTIFTVLGLVFVFLGIRQILNAAELKKRCTGTARAEVVAIRTQVVTHSERKNRTTKETQYAPVLKYTVNGREYSPEPTVYKSRCSEKKGDVIEIKYDPADPNDFYYGSSPANKTLGTVFAGMGGVFALIGILVPVNLSKAKKRANQNKSILEE